MGIEPATPATPTPPNPLQPDGTANASQTPLNEVLHEILEIIANATVDGKIPEQTPDQKEILHQLRFSLTDFIDERGEYIITATIGFN
jgi:hypothetical protein